MSSTTVCARWRNWKTNDVSLVTDSRRKKLWLRRKNQCRKKQEQKAQHNAKLPGKNRKWFLKSRQWCLFWWSRLRQQCLPLASRDLIAVEAFIGFHMLRHDVGILTSFVNLILNSGSKVYLLRHCSLNKKNQIYYFLVRRVIFQSYFWLKSNLVFVWMYLWYLRNQWL